MIFVTVGTQEAPFDRLVRVVERFPDGEEIVVQHGSSQLRPANATLHEFLTHEQMVEHVSRARIVIAHAGVGSTMLALQEGKRPVLVPRLASHNEHPDDHQHEFAYRLEQAGLVKVVDDPEELPAVVASGEDFTLPPRQHGGELVDDLRGYLETLVRQ